MDAVHGAWRPLTLGVTGVFGGNDEFFEFDFILVVQANGAHMLPPEVDLDLFTFKFPVDIGHVIFDGLILQLDMMVLGYGTHHSLIPYRDAIIWAGFGGEFADYGGKDCVRVPIHQWSQI